MDTAKETKRLLDEAFELDGELVLKYFAIKLGRIAKENESDVEVTVSTGAHAYKITASYEETEQ